MAQLTLQIPDAAVPRVRAALRQKLGLDHLPSVAEIQDYLRSHLKEVAILMEQERLRGEVAPEATRIVEGDFGT